jgi:hypothetical protein
MALQPQTSSFPPIYQMEQTWQQNIRASLSLLAAGYGVRSGLKMGLPLDGDGKVTTGLIPTLTDGYLVRGDQVLGPYGSKLVSAAEPGLVNRKVWFGLKGLNYAEPDNLPPLVSDALVATLSTDSAAPASIIHIGQPYNYGGGRMGVRGVINLAKCPKGADTTFFNWETPRDGLPWAMPSAEIENVRVTYAQARMLEVPDATGDFVLKIKNGDADAVTLTTIAGAGQVEDGISRKIPVNADPLSFYRPEALTFQYSQAGANAAGGAVEVMIILEIF